MALALVSVLFLWTPSAQAATYQELRNGQTLKCLAILNSTQANGTEAIQWTCNDDTDQRWELHDPAESQDAVSILLLPALRLSYGRIEEPTLPQGLSRNIAPP